MEKKLMALLLAMALIVCLLSATAWSNGGWGGTRKKEPSKAGNVYQIGSAEEFVRKLWLQK